MSARQARREAAFKTSKRSSECEADLELRLSVYAPNVLATTGGRMKPGTPGVDIATLLKSYEAESSALRRSSKSGDFPSPAGKAMLAAEAAGCLAKGGAANSRHPAWRIISASAEFDGRRIAFGIKSGLQKVASADRRDKISLLRRLRRGSAACGNGECRGCRVKRRTPPHVPRTR